MQKVDGVRTVGVSLNNGLTILDLKPGNAVMMAKLRQIIKNNGFVSREAAVIARGEQKPHQAFVVDGTNEQMVISGTPHKVGDNWRFTAAAPNP